MTEADNPGSAKGPKPGGSAAERKARLAKALRENMRRRKAQARARKASDADPSASETEPGSDGEEG